MAHESNSLDSSGAFSLSYKGVVELLGSVNLGVFIERLAAEIEIVYQDPNISPRARLGWSESPNAREIMTCAAKDLTCAKRISSVPANNDLLTVPGSLLCTDNKTERDVLVCDATLLTPLRTAATSAVLLRRVKPNARSLSVVGAGLEGMAHAVAIVCMVESIESVRFLDINEAQAAQAVEDVKYLLERNGLSSKRNVQIDACNAGREICQCDALVTATYAERSEDVLKEAEGVQDGTFIAAVGADLERKRELPDQLYERAKFLVDDLGQCLVDGELQYAKKLTCTNSEVETALSREDSLRFRGTLASGRIVSVADFFKDPASFLKRPEAITIYDSAGFSGQDLAVARVMLRVLDEQGWERQPWHPKDRGSLRDTACDERHATKSLSQNSRV